MADLRFTIGEQLFLYWVIASGLSLARLARKWSGASRGAHVEGPETANVGLEYPLAGMILEMARQVLS